MAKATKVCGPCPIRISDSQLVIRPYLTTFRTKETMTPSRLLYCGLLTEWEILYQAQDSPSHLISLQYGWELLEERANVLFISVSQVSNSKPDIWLMSNESLLDRIENTLIMNQNLPPLKLYIVIYGNRITMFFFHTSSLWGIKKEMGWELNVYWAFTKCQVYMVSKYCFIWCS